MQCRFPIQMLWQHNPFSSLLFLPIGMLRNCLNMGPRINRCGCTQHTAYKSQETLALHESDVCSYDTPEITTVNFLCHCRKLQCRTKYRASYKQTLFWRTFTWIHLRWVIHSSWKLTIQPVRVRSNKRNNSRLCSVNVHFSPFQLKLIRLHVLILEIKPDISYSVRNSQRLVLLQTLPLFQNIRCFSLFWHMYLDIF
jgi:hypothetical protein